MPRAFKGFFLLLFCLMLASIGEAATGVIRGKVEDLQGGALPGATITAENLNTNARVKSESKTDGTYVLVVMSGVYRVTVEMAGFTTSVVDGIRVGSGQTVQVDIRLKVGAIEECITVTSYNPASRPYAVKSTQGGQSVWDQPRSFNTEAYDHVKELEFRDPRKNPLSTFSIDVDTASYANVRRFLSQGQKPPEDAVRIEELINYFSYDYPAPEDGHPFSIAVEISACPWNSKNRIARVGLGAKPLDGKVPPRNLVFLIDVSGSMDESLKLPLLKRSLALLVEQLTEHDRVAMVVYAGSSGLVLPSTPGDQKAKIMEALERLDAGGSTHGAAGIQLAYRVAEENFIQGGVNRVILATDGDFNVGVTDDGALVRLIEEKRATGVFLSVLGFGAGNLKDSKMEKLADHGNGNYSYIDSLFEGRKVLVAEAGATLVTVAKDVKIQIEFNPKRVAAYRLIGYENRMLADEEFNDDKKDAGEMGAGHTVTAIYEIVPKKKGVIDAVEAPSIDPLKYQTERRTSRLADGRELMTVKVRYKALDGKQSRLFSRAVIDEGDDTPSDDLGFASAVAEFGMILRDSKHKGEASLDGVLDLARRHRGADAHGYRAEFIRLAEMALTISG